MTALTDHLYLRRASLVSVTDGDTFVADVDLGFYAWMRIKCRIVGMDTPEPHGATKRMGERAASVLEALLAPMRPLLIETEKAKAEQSFDRWLCRAWLQDFDTLEWRSVADRMIAEGYARPYDGKKARLPWDPTQPYPLQGDLHV